MRSEYKQRVFVNFIQSIIIPIVMFGQILKNTFIHIYQYNIYHDIVVSIVQRKILNLLLFL